jgi:hypothetical protein
MGRQVIGIRLLRDDRERERHVLVSRPRTRVGDASRPTLATEPSTGLIGTTRRERY